MLAPHEPDVFVSDHGSILLFSPASHEGSAWLAEKLEDAIPWGDSYVVEHRYATDIMIGLYEHGLTVAPE